MDTIQIRFDGQIVGKSGLMLFTQRHINDFFIKIEKCGEDAFLIDMTPKREMPVPPDKELYNELLECEFLAERYEQTKDLRAAIIEQIRSVNKSDDTEV